MLLWSQVLRRKFKINCPLHLPRLRMVCPRPTVEGRRLMVDVHGELHRTVDAVVTLGGDGTILHAASLFSSTYVPPILSFSLGTLGFLLPFSNPPIIPVSSTHLSSSSLSLRLRRRGWSAPSRLIPCTLFACFPPPCRLLSI